MASSAAKKVDGNKAKSSSAAKKSTKVVPKKASTKKAAISETKSRKSKASFGELFVKARKSKGLSLQQAAHMTRMREAYITAMESEKLVDLPGHFYIKAYTKVYARFLDLDEAEIQELVEKKAPEIKEEDVITPVPYRDEFNPGRAILVGSLVLAVLAFIGWQQYQEYVQRDMARNDDAVKVVGVAAETQKDKVLELMTNEDPVISVVALKSTVVTVLDQMGDEIEARQMRAGDTLLIEENNRTLQTANMELVEVYVDANKVASFDTLEARDGGLVLDFRTLLTLVSVE